MKMRPYKVGDRVRYVGNPSACIWAQEDNLQPKKIYVVSEAAEGIGIITLEGHLYWHDKDDFKKVTDKKEGEIKYFYFHSPKNQKGESVKHGVITIAVQKSGNFLFYGFSMCAPGDRFVKATGRKYASNRIKDLVNAPESPDSKYANIIAKRDDSTTILKFQILADIINHNTKLFSPLPDWAEDIVMYHINNILLEHWV